MLAQLQVRCDRDIQHSPIAEGASQAIAKVRDLVHEASNGEDIILTCPEEFEREHIFPAVFPIWGLPVEQEDLTSILAAVWMSTVGVFFSATEGETMREDNYIRSHVKKGVLRSHRICYSRYAGIVRVMDDYLSKKDKDSLWQNNIRNIFGRISCKN